MSQSPSSPFVSIIIAFYKDNKNLQKCLNHCEKLDYPNFEIIVVGNSEPLYSGTKIRWLKIDAVDQGSKKDTGVANAKGEIVAFVDDDAYPQIDWLKNAMKFFIDSEVGAVCGPGVKLPNESFKEQVSSAFWDSPLGSGPARYRYVPTKRFIEYGEAPGYNFLVRRFLMLEVGGIASVFRSGEDAILSEKIRRSGKKIVYAPDVVVYHHRRPFVKPLLKQIFTYGTHRGHFLRHVPAASSKGDPIFMLPLINAVLFTCSLIIILSQLPYTYLQLLCQLYVLTNLFAYLGASFISSIFVTKNLLVSVIATFAIPIAHFTYALGYLKGLTTSELGAKPSH